MPTYQYACTECGHRLEAVQSFTDQALTECPQCAGRLRKVFSAVGVVFKGSGFYRTDSRSANGKSGTGTSGAAKEGVGASKDGAGSKSGGSSNPDKSGSTEKARTAGTASTGSTAKSA